MMACRICGCTEDNACGAGCWWVPTKDDRAAGGKPERGPICSECFQFKKLLQAYFDNSEHVSGAALRRMFAEVPNRRRSRRADLS